MNVLLAWAIGFLRKVEMLTLPFGLTFVMESHFMSIVYIPLDVIREVNMGEDWKEHALSFIR